MMVAAQKNHLGGKILYRSLDISKKQRQCSSNQIKVDRAPLNTHWGRIDSRTGVDQRAEVALLSRNVRFYGEMSSDNCTYAFTRESLDTEAEFKTVMTKITIFSKFRFSQKNLYFQQNLDFDLKFR